MLTVLFLVALLVVAYLTRDRWSWSWLPLVLFALVVLLWPVAAIAAGTGASSGVGDQLGDALNKLLVTTVITVITAVGHQLWGWLRTKRATARIVKVLDEHAVTQQIAEVAIDYAEELAHQAVKAGRAYSSELKENAAVKRGLELLEKSGLAEAARVAAAEELRKVILARLGATRGPTGGARLLSVASSR